MLVWQKTHTTVTPLSHPLSDENAVGSFFPLKVSTACSDCVVQYLYVCTEHINQDCQLKELIVELFEIKPKLKQSFKQRRKTNLKLKIKKTNINSNYDDAINWRLQKVDVFP